MGPLSFITRVHKLRPAATSTRRLGLGVEIIVSISPRYRGEYDGEADNACRRNGFHTCRYPLTLRITK
jgi:hypothetical protein